MAQLLYGPAIHQAIRSGNLAEMKTLVQHAEQHLQEQGDIRSALEILRLEIAKLESKHQ